MSRPDPAIFPCDVVLVGAGVMSATLGTMLKLVEPSLRIHVFERLDGPAEESSNAWNNAGTGHAGLCELNYTPMRADGSIDLHKAELVVAQYEQSKQYWAHLHRLGLLDRPGRFLHSVPHLSFVRGEQDVRFLRERHRALATAPLFAGMEFTDDPREIARWAPLLVEGRDPHEALGATRSSLGTDVDFGALTRALFAGLASAPDVHLWYRHEVRDLERLGDRGYRVSVEDRTNGTHHVFEAAFVFLGAGGGSLELLDRADVDEAKGYGGFPVGGQWLRCRDPRIVERHHAKVYGKAALGAPPMSVPHLDTRFVDGQRALLFGPFACFSTKFLKNGSWLDLPASIEPDNILPMLHAGFDNLDLTKYLIEQVLLSPEERLEALRAYMPSAELEDWELVTAGQRVQVIKSDEERGGILEFGTELVVSADGSLAALLGASPGASTAVSTMLGLLERCLPQRFGVTDLSSRLRSLVPSHGEAGEMDLDRQLALRAASHATLGLVDPS